MNEIIYKLPREIANNILIEYLSIDAIILMLNCSVGILADIIKRYYDEYDIKISGKDGIHLKLPKEKLMKIVLRNNHFRNNFFTYVKLVKENKQNANTLQVGDVFRVYNGKRCYERRVTEIIPKSLDLPKTLKCKYVRIFEDNVVYDRDTFNNILLIEQFNLYIDVPIHYLYSMIKFKSFCKPLGICDNGYLTHIIFRENDTLKCHYIS